MTSAAKAELNSERGSARATSSPDTNPAFHPQNAASSTFGGKSSPSRGARGTLLPSSGASSLPQLAAGNRRTNLQTLAGGIAFVSLLLLRTQPRHGSWSYHVAQELNQVAAGGARLLLHLFASLPAVQLVLLSGCVELGVGVGHLLNLGDLGGVLAGLIVLFVFGLELGRIVAQLEIVFKVVVGGSNGCVRGRLEIGAIGQVGAGAL